MQEWIRKCKKKENKSNNWKYIYECCVKMWNDLNNWLTIAWDKKIENFWKINNKYIKCKSE